MNDIIFVIWNQLMYLNVLENIIVHIPESCILTDTLTIKQEADKKGFICNTYQELYGDLKEEAFQSKVLVACEFYSMEEKPKKTICVNTFHGVAGKSYSYSHTDIPKWNLFLIAGNYSRRRLIDYHHIEDEKMFIIGSPKLDSLFNGSLDKDKILLELNLDKNRKTIFYCPTYDLSSEGDMLEYLEQIDGLNINIIIKLHDASYFKEAYSEKVKELKNTVLVNDYRVTPYMFASDLMISDRSSAAFDYLVLNRPIIFLQDTNAIEHFIGGGDVRDKELEVEYRNVGERLNTMDELLNTIFDCLSNPEKKEEQRLKVRDELFSYCDGNSGKRAADILSDILRKKTEQGE